MVGGISLLKIYVISFDGAVSELDRNAAFPIQRLFPLEVSPCLLEEIFIHGLSTSCDGFGRACFEREGVPA